MGAGSGIMLEGTRMILGQREPNGYQQITSLGSAVGLTLTNPGSNLCLIQPETQSVRWRDDGTAPTATVGNLIAAGDVLEYVGKLESIQIIETTASAKVNVNYYR